MKKVKLFSLLAILALVMTLSGCKCSKDKECEEHSWGEWEITQNATCLQEGSKVRHCSECEESETGVIEKVAHSYTNYVNNNETLCTVDRTATASCDYGCGTTDTKVVLNAPGHSHVETSRVEAKCEEDGHVVYTCSCGDSYTETIKAQGHNYEKEETIKVSCTVNGLNTYKCSNCGDSYTEVVLATGHNYELVSEVKVTCTTDGSKEYECSCGDSYTETIKAQGHNHELVSEVVVTCEEDGSREYECSCGDSYTEVVLATGHNYEVTNETVLSCTTDAKTSYTCSNCNDSYDVISAYSTGHTVTEWVLDEEHALSDCQVEQHYSGVCTECSETDSKVETVTKHTYTDKVVVTKLATCQEAGVKTYYCVCGAEEEKPYENADAHNWVADTDVVALNDASSVSYHCSECNETKSEIIIASTTGSVSKENLASSGVALETATIALDSQTVDGLASGDVSLTAEVLAGDDLEAVKNKMGENANLIGDNKIYNFGMSDSQGIVSDFNGLVTVTVPYTLGAEEDPESIAIWFVDENGNVDTIKAVYANGYATFQTNHFSYYTVTRLSAKERCALYGHVYTDIVVDPTCTKGGYTLHVCQRCGESTKGSLTEALGHNMTSAVTQPTCTKNGKEVWSCQNPGCNHSYTTVIKATGHTFTTVTEQASCTEDGKHTHTCTNDDCGYSYVERIPATGHNYSTVEVPATCLENGLKTHTCTCGDTYQEVVLAKGHKWTVVERVDATTTAEGYIDYDCANCDATHHEVLPKLDREVNTPNLDLLIGALESLLDQKMYVTLTDVYVKVAVYSHVQYGETIVEYVEYFVEELYITLDENNELIGSGSVRGVNTDGDEVIDATIDLYLEGDKVYVVYVSSDNDVPMEWGVANLVAFIQDEMPMDEIPAEQVTAILEMAQKWYDESFYQIVDSLEQVNGIAVREALEAVVSKVFNFVETENGHNISLNIAGLQELSDFLYENTLYDIIEKVLGNKILENLDLVFDFSVGQLIDFLAEKGFVLDEVFASLDDLVVVMAEAGMVPEEVSTVNELVQALTGSEEAIDIKAIIESEDVQNITVGDFILMVITSVQNNQPNVEEKPLPDGEVQVKPLSETEESITIEDIKAMIEGVLEECKSYTVFNIIAGNMNADEEEFKQMVDQIISMVSEGLTIDANLNSEGVVVDANINLNFEVEDTAAKGKISIDSDFVPTIDKSSIKAPIEKDLEAIDVLGNIETIIKYEWPNSKVEFNYNEQEELESVKIVKFTEMFFIEYETINAEDIVNYLAASKYATCSGWYNYEFEIKSTVTCLYVEKGYEDTHESTYSLDVYYNPTTKQFGNYSIANHDMVINEEKSTPATGCTGVGTYYYECRKCDHYEIDKYTNGHDMVFSSAELLGATCEDGVVITYACKNCDYIDSFEEHHHYSYTRYLDLTQYGAVCDSKIEFNECACGYRNDWWFHFECDFDSEYVYYESHYDCVEVYTCAVTDPQCAFKYAVERVSTKDAQCRVTVTTKYHFGITGVNYDEATNTYTIENAQYVMTRPSEDYGYNHDTQYYNIESTETINHYGYRCACGYYHEHKTVCDANGKEISYEVKHYYPAEGYTSTTKYTYVYYNEGEQYISTIYESTEYSDGSKSHWSSYSYTYDFTGDRCMRTVNVTYSGGSTDTYTESCCIYEWHSESTHTDHPCTQSTITYERYGCRVCGHSDEKENSWENAPKGHDWYWDSEQQIYVCYTCGLKNANGADGAVILEDATVEGSDTLTVGYYNRASIEYTLSITLILHEADAEGNNEVFISGVDFTYAEEGRYVSFSKADVVALATALGYSEDQYNIRISFVPVNASDDLDYAITFE